MRCVREETRGQVRKGERDGERKEYLSEMCWGGERWGGRGGFIYIAMGRNLSALLNLRN